MRFLSVNHLRLGATPGGVPDHIAPDLRPHSSRAAWSRIVALAIRENVHALVLSGQTIAAQNSGLEPFGPLLDGLAELQQASIPVVIVPNGSLQPERIAKLAPTSKIAWLRDTLDWQPPLTTQTDEFDRDAIHVIPASLAESANAPVQRPLTVDQLDQPGAIWLLTNERQPDSISTGQALIVEPGAVTALNAHEIDRHGVWLIDTDMREATLIPIASLEFASIDIDITVAQDQEDVERIVAQALISAAETARADDSIATRLVVQGTLAGDTHLYAQLADIAVELERTLLLEHDGITIGLLALEIDAHPQIELAALLNRPDPVGELARLINALDTGAPLSDAQQRLLQTAEQKQLAVAHARVFGAIVDHAIDIDPTKLLLRQSWATLDALVRQRGID